MGKVLGGGSVLNLMIYNRGNRRDYDTWAAKGAVGWSYDEVLPYFKRSENNTDATLVSNGKDNVDASDHPDLCNLELRTLADTVPPGVEASSCGIINRI